MLSELIEKCLIVPRPSVVEWAEKNLVLPSSTSPNDSGPFTVTHTPYLREVLETFRGDAILERVTCSFATQVGKTTAAIIGAGYTIDQDPRALLWALPSEKLCRSFSAGRLRPFFDQNPVIARHKPANLDDYKILEMFFDENPIYFVGVNESANLSARPISLAICDEVAKYRWDNHDEAHPVDLISERTKGASRHCVYEFSTPNTKQNYFWRSYLAGDQRQYVFPCPYCAAKIGLEFKKGEQNLIWDSAAKNPNTGEWDLERVERTARYRCPYCHGEIYNHDKQKLLNLGEWRPHNQRGMSGHQSYHLNSLYSPYVSFGRFAKEYLKSKKNKQLHNFYNSWKAEPWAETIVEINSRSIEDLKGDYARGTLPIVPAYVSVCYDPGNVTHWVVSAFSSNGDQYIIDWGTILDYKKAPEHLESLTWVGPDGHTYSPRNGLNFIDAGWSTDEIYNTCYNSRIPLYPTRGLDTRFGSYNSRELVQYPGLYLFTYSDHIAKTELYSSRIAKGGAPRLILPANVDHDLIMGLSGQELIEESGSRTTRMYWKKVAGDHLGDCIKIGQVGWWSARAQIVT